MRKKIFSILAGVMMIALTVAGVVYAREVFDLEVEGRVEGVDTGSLLVDGDLYMIVEESEVDEEIIVGDWVKIKYYVDEEEQMIIVEAEIEDEPEMDYEEFELYGTVEGLTDDVLTVDGEDYLIMPESKIEEEIGVGDYVKVKFYEDDEGQFILIEAELEDEDEMDDGDMEPGAVCSGDLEHPVLSELAVNYEVDYETLKDYFCQGFGVGEIKLALQTAQREDVEESFDQILDRRSTDGMKDVGWGEIWQELGLIGKGKKDSEDSDPEAMMNKNQEEFQFEKESKNKEKNENKPNNPPGRSGNNPGKGKGPGN